MGNQLYTKNLKMSNTIHPTTDPVLNAEAEKPDVEISTGEMFKVSDSQQEINAAGEGHMIFLDINNQDKSLVPV